MPIRLMRCTGCAASAYRRGDSEHAGGWFCDDQFKGKDCILDAAGWVDYPHPESVVGWGPVAGSTSAQQFQQ